MMKYNIILVPLLCLPMAYQFWLLWDEFQNGFAPQIYHRTEPVTDLPGITLCMPFKYAFPKSFIVQRINQSSSEEVNNRCTHYKSYLDNPPAKSSPEEMIAMSRARDVCYDSSFLWSDPDDPLYLRNITSLNDSLIIDSSRFLYLFIYGDLGERHKPTKSVVLPNTVYSDWETGMCWTWFSRSSRDYTEAARTVMETMHTMGESSGHWARTQDGDLREGEIVSRDRPKEWPYRLRGVTMINLSFDYFHILQHWYGIEHKNMSELNRHFKLYGLTEVDLPIRVSVHSPYEFAYLKRSFGSNQWLGVVHRYADEANLILNSYNLSSYNSWLVSYSKTTMQHVSAPGRYSQYLNPGPKGSATHRLRGYSYEDCQKLRTLIDKIERYSTKYPNESICIPLESSMLSNWLQDQLDPLNFSFCPPEKESKHPPLKRPPDKEVNQEIIRILKAKRPKVCPADGQRIVFSFKLDTDGRQIRKEQTGGPDGHQLKYSFQFKLDTVPELTIRYLFKMSVIELLANGCGLSGIWIGFSFLGAINGLGQLVIHLKSSQLTIFSISFWKKSENVRMSVRVNPSIVIHKQSINHRVESTYRGAHQTSHRNRFLFNHTTRR